MSAFEPLDARASLDRHSLGPLVATAIRRWAHASFTKWQRRKMIASLSALDDRILWDIGIHRSEIERAVDGIVDAPISDVTANRYQDTNPTSYPFSKARATSSTKVV